MGCKNSRQLPLDPTDPKAPTAGSHPVVTELSAEEQAQTQFTTVFNGVNLETSTFSLHSLIRDAGIGDLSLKSAPLIQAKAKAPTRPAEARVLAHLRQLFEGVEVNAEGGARKEDLAAVLLQDADLEGLVNEAGLHAEYADLQPLDTRIEGRLTWEELEAYVLHGAEDESVGSPPRREQDRSAAVVLDREEVERPLEPRSGWCC